MTEAASNVTRDTAPGIGIEVSAIGFAFGSSDVPSLTTVTT